MSAASLQDLVTQCLVLLRRRRGLNQTELGERMGVGRRRITAIEGDSNLTLLTVERYLEALGFTTRDLVNVLAHQIDLDAVLGTAESSHDATAVGVADVEALEEEAERIQNFLFRAAKDRQAEPS